MEARLYHLLAAKVHAEPHAAQRCSCAMQMVVATGQTLDS